ncbi:MAG TPA: sugar phosphate isomerase/epimerase [Vicinamibacteria bacterium]|nr:sugar phosphate isomerase/epimerase [Vicinamibacteria bacterium]
MARPVTIFTGQWADLPCEEMCRLTRSLGYDGIELACWGDHFEVDRAARDAEYVRRKRELLARHELQAYAISNHLVGQAVCDPIDERHRSILPDHVWGDGDPEGVRRRAADEMVRTGESAQAFGVDTVVGFTGSSVWHLLYAFPPTPQKMIDRGYEDFKSRFMPILDAYQKLGVRFALEVHPTEIAFDIVTAERALQAVGQHPAFGFNFDPSHFGYQGVDYVEFLHRFGDRIFNVHIKDVAWRKTPGESGTFGGHLDFGDRRRQWDFRSPGRGDIDFQAIIRALNEVGYRGPLSVEWEDNGMDRVHGAREACEFVRRMDFVPPASGSFDDAFAR